MHLTCNVLSGNVEFFKIGKKCQWRRKNNWTQLKVSHFFVSKHITKLQSLKQCGACVCAQSHPWTVACQASLSMGFSRARVLKRVAMPSCRGHVSLTSSAWAGRFCSTSASWDTHVITALFTAVKVWKQCKCLSVGEWIERCVLYPQWNIVQPQEWRLWHFQQYGWNEHIMLSKLNETE